MNTPLARLTAILDQLPPAARRIADEILSRPDAVIEMSVADLATAARASEGSVIALVQQIGARGFPDLKIGLAREISAGRRLLHEDVRPGDDARAVLDKVTTSHLQALQDTRDVVDPDAVSRAVALMLGAQRIEIYGVGTAGPVAEDASARLIRLGLQVKAITDSHAQAVSAGFTGPSVVTLTISHTGRTHDTLAATRLARDAGARTICITNFGRSPLSDLCEVVLHTAASETRYRVEAMSSRLAQLLIIDVLYAALGAARWNESLTAISRSHDILAGKRVPPQPDSD
jgi:DNA-binding MurR/RpiR family transcriptional regulator